PAVFSSWLPKTRGTSVTASVWRMAIELAAMGGEQAERTRAKDATTQVAAVGFLAFCGPGLFNALNGLGNAGSSDPRLAALANGCLYCTFAVFGYFGGAGFNLLGPKPLLCFGGLTYAVYATCIFFSGKLWWLAPLGGVVLGLGAGLFWTAQGSLMMAYATPNSRGRLIAIFWVIFNLGGVMGGLLQFGLNFHTSGSSANPISYFTFVVVMGLGALMSPLLADPSSVVREDGTPVLFQQAESPLAELRAAIAAIGDPFILRNLLFYLASNWFYTYNFNGFNGQQFNVRSRGLNSAGFWAAQMWAAWWFGKVLDEEVAPRRRAWRGLLLVALSLAFSLGWALQAPWLPSPSGPSRAPRAPRVPRVPPAPLAPGAPPALIPQLGWRAALVVGLRLARLARLARKAKAKVAVKEVEKLDELTDRVKQNHPDQQWLFGKTRPKYLEQVPEALHREVENLCDLELYLLGQQEDQTAFLAQLKSLQTSSGCRLFGVPRSSFLQRKISKVPKAELAWLSDAELLDLGN
ncbi:unnamed protein product, partial [Effrenium voratum]